MGDPWNCTAPWDYSYWKVLENIDITLGALLDILDIEGDFYGTSSYVIIKAVKRHGLRDNLSMYRLYAGWQKKNHIQLHRRNSGGFCGQGSVLAPLLRSLLVGELKGLYWNDCYTLGDADDILSSLALNFRTPSQSFCTRLWVQYSSAVIGLNCLSIHKRLW
jgi:hypothetical protein